MALKHSGKAFGKVAELVCELLERHHPASADSLKVKVARPLKQNSLPLLTVFLYEAHLDPHMRNTVPHDGSANWLWYELHFLLTAFDSAGESDSAEALGLLSEAARVLQGFGFLALEQTPPLDPDLVLALRDNPEPLKLTFDDARADLISRLMSPDDKYPFSLAFQVRPVMIAPGDPARFSQLVGIDYNAQPNVAIGADGVRQLVVPSMGPVLEELLPPAFRPGDKLMLVGTDLFGVGIQAWLGELELPITAQSSAGLTCTVPAAIDNGTSLAAGDQTVRVSVPLPSGRPQWSNGLIGGLLPTITGAAIANLAIANHPVTQQPTAAADLELQGKLLGRVGDDILVGLLRDGVLVRSFDSFAFASPNHQELLKWSLTVDDQIAPGNYLVLLKVNGRQSRTSITLDLT